jgi:phospholipid/cholesterol/gamma-HCH transport system permease protein
MVTAFQAIVQLRQFGADIFVADLVALSVARELGPLMTAIIVAGRSGAAFSAELGTMSVSEEIDALRTLGLSPYGFLVYPRVLALVVVVPLLTLVGDLCGILGGVFVSMLRLDITLTAYWSVRRTSSILGRRVSAKSAPRLGDRRRPSARHARRRAAASVSTRPRRRASSRWS